MMADEEKTEEPQAEEPQAEEAKDEAPPEEEAAAEAPADEEAPAEKEEVPDEEPAAEGEAEEAPAEQPAAEEPAAEAPAEKPADDEQLSHKERRRLERSRAGGPPRPQRSPEDRAAERAERRAAAKERRRRHRASRRARRGESKQGTPPAERETPAVRKTRQGTVVSSKADKTIAVRIELVRRHPLYEKVVRNSHTVHAHDERNEAREGDLVRIVESRPMSRTKRWRLVEVLERAPVRTAAVEPSEEPEIIEVGGAAPAEESAGEERGS